MIQSLFRFLAVQRAELYRQVDRRVWSQLVVLVPDKIFVQNTELETTRLLDRFRRARYGAA